MSLFGSAADPGQLLESGGTWTLVAVTTAWLEVHFLFIQLENKKNTGQLNMELIEDVHKRERKFSKTMMRRVL